jgi:hypothetical protein
MTSDFPLKRISMIPVLSDSPQASNFGALGALRWAKSGVWHLAAFLAGLPSKGQEIDDKLQSNSR